MDFSALLRLPSDGWRKTAVINTGIVGFFAIANVSTLIWSLSKSSVSENNIFREGDCDQISVINTLLHLLLNIASSLIIASSNFFMQVLNSPTRAEVDRAHARKKWLEIGVPSLRNVLSVSPYKSLVWVLFSLSSIPIHLLFNSSVFTVDYSGADWSMALVSESLLHGAPYSLPGAGLTLNGTHCRRLKNLNPIIIAMEDLLAGELFGSSYDNFEDSSQGLAAVIVSATQNLSVAECKSEYQTCRGLRKYRNLLLVIESGREATDSRSWDINDLYDMEETVGNVYDLSALEFSDDKLQNETFRSIWEPRFESTSMSQPNSLWFTSPCYKTADSSPDGCINSCTGPLGLTRHNSRHMISDAEVKSSNWEFPWLRVRDSGSALISRSTWDEELPSLTYNPELWPNQCRGIPRPSYQADSTNDIRVRYCLAEPFEPGCKLATSNIIFLVVTVCIFIKLVLCLGVVLALRDDPLVTPGDAVSSFIAFPDPTTVGRCAAAIPDIRSRPLERKPLQWQGSSRRLAHTISRLNWITNYAFFITLMIILGFVMDGAFHSYSLSDV